MKITKQIKDFNFDDKSGCLYDMQAKAAEKITNRFNRKVYALICWRLRRYGLLSSFKQGVVKLINDQSEDGSKEITAIDQEGKKYFVCFLYPFEFSTDYNVVHNSYRTFTTLKYR